jgi:amidase
MSRVARAIPVGWSFLVGLALGLARTRPRRLRPLDFRPFGEALAGLSAERDHELASVLARATMADVQGLMDRGELTSEELALHHLARIRRRDAWLRSVIELDPQALADARAADARRHSSGALGPLDGIPVTIKDNIETAGPLHTTAGSMALSDHVASQDAPVVAALRDAGAVILGKANLSELAGAVARTPGVSAVGGQVRNPFGERFTPGGSSSGSAVSVAAGLAMASVGTETSGSLVAPASFNGVVGMKPSRGLVSGEGIVPLVRTQDSAGPIARCVADAAALLSVISTGGLKVDLTPAGLDGIAVGLLRTDVVAARSPLEDTSDNEAVLARIEDGLRRAGAIPSDVTLAGDGSPDAVQRTLARVVFGGLAHDTMGYVASASAPVATLAQLHRYNLRHPRLRMPKGQAFLSMAYLLELDRAAYEQAALDVRADAARILDATFEATRVAALVSIGHVHSPLYASAGFPAITVPVGLRASGMPVGATFIGRLGEDARLLGRAYAFEQATRWRVDPPERPPS